MQSKLSHCLWFDRQAEEAARFYVSIFKGGKIENISHYTEEGFEIHGMPKGTVMTVDYEILGLKYKALNGGPLFKFNEAFSIVVNCESQAEIDYYWTKLAKNEDEGQCGWLKDPFGVSWQIVPTVLSKMMSDPDSKKVQRVTHSFLRMKKFNIAELERAFAGA